MENESFNKNNISYVKLITPKEKIIKKRNNRKEGNKRKRRRYFLKNIISILLFLIALLIIILLIILIIFLLLKSKFSKSYNSIKEISNFGKKNQNNSNVLNINYTSYLENKLKELQKPIIEWPLPNQIRFRPLMNKEDLMGFLSFMKPNLTYFEFGSGGSTNIASYYKLKVYSVESDAIWHNKLKNSNINATYITVDLKATQLGYPGNNTTIEDWKRYYQSYDSNYNADIILIDGRFRVVCGLDIFSKIRNDTLVLIHDYSHIEKYHILEKYYIKVKKWDSLSAFFKNPNITSIPQNVYNEYMYDKQI